MIGDLEIKRLDNNRLNLYFVCDSSITLTEQEEEWVKMATLKQFDGKNVVPTYVDWKPGVKVKCENGKNWIDFTEADLEKLQNFFNEELGIQAYYEEQAEWEAECCAARAENYDFDYGDYKY